MLQNKLLIVLSSWVVTLESAKIYFEGDLYPGTNRTIVLRDDPNVVIPREAIIEDLKGEEVKMPDVAVSRGVGRLALQLNKAIKSQMSTADRENSVYSPLSIALALALLLLGAKGETYNELINVLGLPGDLSNSTVESLHEEFARMFNMLEEKPSAKNDVLLTLASGVFVQEHFKINSDYNNISKSLYKSEVLSVDFMTKGKEAMNIINNWVLNRTDGHILNLLVQPLSFETKVVIVNALYFNGGWEVPFLPAWTNKQKFYTTPNEHVLVNMMVNAAETYYYGDKEKKVLGLAYKGNNTIMYFVVPNSDLNSYVASLDSGSLLDLIQNTTVQMTIYTVPRMKLEKTIHLKEALESMGVKTLFSKSADLGNLAKGVYVNKVIHKVEIEVTETGTTASAATAIDLVRTAAPVVRLDKPFLFFIYHRPTRIITFWGTVFNPTPL